MGKQIAADGSMVHDRVVAIGICDECGRLASVCLKSRCERPYYFHVFVPREGTERVAQAERRYFARAAVPKEGE